MAKVGRPTDYREEYNKQAYKLCLLGSTDKDLSDFFEVSEVTINAWKNEFPEFLKSIKAGKQQADANVAGRLYKRALGFVAPDIITAQKDGVITDMKEIQKHYPPDTTAAIFWLKNRQPKLWRDKQDIEHSGDIKINIDDTDAQL